MTGMRRSGRAIAGAIALVVTLASCTSSGAATSARRGANPYFVAPFTTRANSYTFGQDPSFTADARVLSNENDAAGVRQVFVSDLAGSHPSCLTCGQPGPNGFPQERPQGDWILFCSWRDSHVTFGAPCLGGFGTDLYVMRPDGSHVQRLTAPAAGEGAGPAYDNYHPYWSPDGRQIAWTHVVFADRAHGGTQWTILTADFTLNHTSAPRLTNVTTVAPAGDTAYETQSWAPDGTGVLYTSLTSHGDPAAGWLNSELYFLRLHGHAATPAHPKAIHLTDNHPGWDEQAVFTPDMRDIIWMSSRGSPTWYQSVVTAAQTFGKTPPLENDTAGPMFVLAILDPRFHTELYELDLASHAIRRLTFLHQVVPEFVFDSTGTRLLWSDGGRRATNIGTFSLATHPKAIARPVAHDPRWKRAHAPNTTRPTPVRAGAPTLNPTNLPLALVDAFALLESQLAGLASRLAQLPQGGKCCEAPDA